jgi:hypothetical protein
MVASVLTDPKKADYICEHGATRNFEIWRKADDAPEEGPKEEDNPMKV